MAKAYILSDDDTRLLREVINDYRQRRQERPNRGLTPDSSTSPDTYVVRTPAGGIPALTFDPGHGIADQPGVASCQVYQRINPELGLLATLKPVSGFALPVCNLCVTAIPGDAWATVSQDAYGSWWIDRVCSSTPDVETGTGTGVLYGCTCHISSACVTTTSNCSFLDGLSIDLTKTADFGTPVFWSGTVTVTVAGGSTRELALSVTCNNGQYQIEFYYPDGPAPNRTFFTELRLPLGCGLFDDYDLTVSFATSRIEDILGTSSCNDLDTVEMTLHFSEGVCGTDTGTGTGTGTMPACPVGFIDASPCCSCVPPILLLVITVPGPPGTCDCASLATITLNYAGIVGGNHEWQGANNICGGPWSAALACVSGAWRLSVTCFGGGNFQDTVTESSICGGEGSFSIAFVGSTGSSGGSCTSCAGGFASMIFTVT